VIPAAQTLFRQTLLRPDAVIGVLHPGEMGAALATQLRQGRRTVLWASTGRGDDTIRRAEDADLRDACTVEEVVGSSDLILSVCPPHAALDVAGSVAGFTGIFVDANAVSPATAHEIADVIEEGGGRFVDGGIVGPPPRDGVPTRLYLSGHEAARVAGLFEDTVVQARVLSDEPGTASALKMVYAAWSKGTAALLLAIRAVARAEGVEDALLDEWQESIPELPERSLRAATSAGRKGWRWVGEMEEIASTFAAARLPDGFHAAAAEVYRRMPKLEGVDAADALDRIVDALLAAERQP
jgi:3-hydroxyisobutyrate dehydrogenase-like beta-hydroxyacid dehydrogenase